MISASNRVYEILEKATGLVIVSTLALTLSGCEQRNSSAASSREAIGTGSVSVNQRSWSGHVCGLSHERMDFCPTDFSRLAANPLAAEGKEVWILGYLAIDGGHLALFATKEDYLDMQYGRSIRVLGSREQLENVFAEFGNRKIRLRGKFRANAFDDPRNDRLGELLQPVTGKLASPRSDTEGVQDIRVDVRNLTNGDGATVL